MLVLSRRLGQKIVFPSIQTTVQFVSTKAGVIRLGIDAPEEIAVYREELLEKKDFQPAEKSGSLLSDSAANALVNLLNNRLNDSSVGLALLRRQLELGLTGPMRDTLDKIEDNVKTIRQRVERLEAERTRPARASKPRALVVEDDRNECELLAGFLRLAGLDVHTAGDGSDALDYLQKQGKPDVVVLDMILPRCDGPTMVRTIRRDPAYSGLRIFGVTGAAVEQFGLDEGPAGIDRWFPKPIDAEALLREFDPRFAANALHE